MIMIMMILIIGSVITTAQFETATVLGTVRDQNNAILRGAVVKLKNVGTGIVSTTQADDNGEYIFRAVKIGTYTVSAELSGFTTSVVQDVVVTVEARKRVDLSLKVGSTAETVTITDSVPLLETDSSSKGQIIGENQISNLPIKGRSYADLALLVPGVRQSQSGNQGEISTRREGSYNVNGLRSVYNNFQLDGIDNNFYGTTNQGYSNQASQPSPDSVAEFKMSINSYSAEYGRSGGAVMIVATKGGTNQFHGRVWDYIQNGKLNAAGFFKPQENRKPQVNRNQFGFVVGGPIIKDKTFFFLDYEGSRWIQSPFSLTTVPTMDQRKGIISGLTTNIIVPYNFTDTNGKQVTAGTVYGKGETIPMTNFAKTVLGNLPEPNRPGSATGANNYGGFARNQLFEDKGALKIDHKINEKLNGFVRYTHRRQHIEQPGLISGFSGGNATGRLSTYNQQGIAGITWTIDSNSMLEYRFAVTRLGMDRTVYSVGGPSMEDLFGITGLPEGDKVRGGITPQDISGFPRYGRQSTSPQAQFPLTVNSKVNYSRVVGRHNLKMGYEYLILNQDVDDTNPLYGIDTYNGTMSSHPTLRVYKDPTCSQYNTLPIKDVPAQCKVNGNSLADFYFGARSNYKYASQVTAKMRQRFHYGYIQDDFKVNQKLTVNAGLRYELVTPVYDGDNKLANFDPKTNSVVLAKDGSMSEKALRNLDTNNFSPRLGIAYQLNDKTVVRSGYGIGYNYWNRMASAELLNTNAPFVTRASVDNIAANAKTICTGDNYTGCFRPTQNGYPTNLLGAPGAVILYMPQDLPWSYVQNWHLTVQRNLTRNSMLDVAYVGNHSVKLPQLADYNQAVPGTGSVLSRRPIKLVKIPGQGDVQVGNITAVLPTSFSYYHALQVKFEHRGKDLNLLNAFTYSKAIDNASQVLDGNGSGPTPQDVNNPRNDKGPSSFDQRFNNTTSVVWDLPIGKSRRFGSNLPKALNFVIGDWQASSAITISSGVPLGIFYGDNAGWLSDGQADFLGGVRPRPNLTCACDILSNEAQRKANPANQDERYEYYFNDKAIALPTAGSPFGNIGRNSAYGFGYQSVDFALQKRFPLSFINETTKLNFRTEFFNFFNHTNFNAPNTDRRSGSFGRVSSTMDPRVIQFALKVEF